MTLTYSQEKNNTYLYITYGMKIQGVARISEPLHYQFCLVTCCAIILENAQIFTFLSQWEKFLLQDVLIPFFIKQRFWAELLERPLPWMKSYQTHGWHQDVSLLEWHGTHGSVLYFPYLFSRCPK